MLNWWETKRWGKTRSEVILLFSNFRWKQSVWELLNCVWQQLRQVETSQWKHFWHVSGAGLNTGWEDIFYPLIPILWVFSIVRKFNLTRSSGPRLTCVTLSRDRLLLSSRGSFGCRSPGWSGHGTEERERTIRTSPATRRSQIMRVYSDLLILGPWTAADFPRSRLTDYFTIKPVMNNNVR